MRGAEVTPAVLEYIAYRLEVTPAVLVARIRIDSVVGPNANGSFTTRTGEAAMRLNATVTDAPSGASVRWSLVEQPGGTRREPCRCRRWHDARRHDRVAGAGFAGPLCGPGPDGAPCTATPFVSGAGGTAGR